MSNQTRCQIKLDVILDQTGWRLKVVTS